MRLVRHCNEKLPGGLKLWRKLARKAGYTGVIEVRGFGTDGNIPTMRKDGRGTITLGYTAILANRYPIKITIYLGRPYAKCARFWPERSHPIFTLAHELGHAWAARHGKRMSGSNFRNYSEWRAMKQEQDADEYAIRLLRRAGVDQEGRVQR